MSYTVIWKPAAEAELATMWSVAADRAAITQAADEIDRLLRSSPHTQGESRSGTVRIMFVAPLVVYCDVAEQDRVVSVLRVTRV